MSDNNQSSRFAFIVPMLTLASFLSGLALVVFPTRDDMHHHISQAVQPVADHVNQHVALPTHPAQQRWSDVLRETIVSLNQRLERLEIQLARLQAALARKCFNSIQGEST